LGEIQEGPVAGSNFTVRWKVFQKRAGLGNIESLRKGEDLS